MLAQSTTHPLEPQQVGPALTVALYTRPAQGWEWMPLVVRVRSKLAGAFVSSRTRRNRGAGKGLIFQRSRPASAKPGRAASSAVP